MTPETSEVTADLMRRLDDLLSADDHERDTRYPGPMRSRQPVHTVYVPGDRYHAATVAEWRSAALECLDEYGPIDAHVPRRSQLPAGDLDAKVRAKLSREPIEDLRIDFEDGYGNRADSEEDEHVVAAAISLSDSIAEGTVPVAIGLRVKSLEGPTRRRAVRTLQLFLSTLLTAADPAVASPGDALPDGFRITLPKATSVAQVVAMTQICAQLEVDHRLRQRRLRFEIQVETPQAILSSDGTTLLSRMIQASDARCIGLHYGTYDYSASVGIAAAFQSMDHPAADYAKAVMQVAAAGTGVPLSDGSTNILPIGEAADVHAGWQLHARLVRRSLERGFYQGWDLHPAQLPTRFAATFAFYRDSMPAAVARLQRYRSRSAGGIIDEPATAQALAGYLCRGLDCAAISEDDIAALLEETAPLDRSVLEGLARR
ncbi:MAG: hypothetical protein QOD87_1501 [Pseudonocardiales bacterium]|nr:hypothetical protein [Pseudonocardiales bacterium]